MASQGRPLRGPLLLPTNKEDDDRRLHLRVRQVSADTAHVPPTLAGSWRAYPRLRWRRVGRCSEILSTRCRRRTSSQSGLYTSDSARATSEPASMWLIHLSCSSSVRDSPSPGPISAPRGLWSTRAASWSPWSRITIEAEDITDAGGSVVATVRQRGVGRESGVATELRYFQVWSFRGRKVIRLENFRSEAEALEAAGLRE
jgi:hypothetical protein